MGEGAVEFSFQWLPFLLDPHTPPQGVTIEDYMAQKGYPPDFYPRVRKQMDAMGAQAGVVFNHEAKDRGGRLVVNTLNSLRLLDYARARAPPYPPARRELPPCARASVAAAARATAARGHGAPHERGAGRPRCRRRA